MYGERDDVHRRAFVELLLTLAVPLELTTLDRLVPPVSTVDVSLAAAAQDVSDAIRNAHKTGPSHYLLSPAQTHAKRCVELLTQRAMAPEVRRGMMRAAGWAFLALGETQLNSDARQPAMNSFTEAEQCAIASGDALLQAHALLGRGCTHHGWKHQGLMFARQAAHQVPASAPPDERSWFFLRAAEAYATRGRKEHFLATVDRAAHALAQSSESGIDGREAGFWGRYGHCLLELGNWTDAEQALQRGLQGPARPRAQSRMLTDLATVYAREGAQPLAYTTVNQALAIATQTGYTRQKAVAHHLHVRLFKSTQ